MKAGLKKRIACAMLTVFVVMSFAGCLKTEEGTKWAPGAMLKIGNTQIDVREGEVYLAAKLMDYRQYYGDDIWEYKIDPYGGTIGDFIKQQVLDEIIYIKIVCEKASESNIVLSNDELQKVEEETREFMKKYGSLGFEESIIRKIYTDNLLARKLFEKSTLNIDTNISNEEAGQHHLYSIAIRNHMLGTNGARVELTPVERAELLRRMETILENARNAQDFYKYAEGITEEAETLDFYAGKGDLNPAYEEEVLTLSAGELSKVCEGKDYYYIFYCVNPLDIDATLAKKEEIIAKRQAEAFETYYEQWRNEITVEINEEVWAEAK